MPRRSRFACFAAGAAIVLFSSTTAEAQVRRGWRGPGVVVNAPGVLVQVGPIGIPGIAYGGPAIGYGLPRGGVFVAPPYGPTVSVLPRGYFAARPLALSAYTSPAPTDDALPTAAELAAMEDAALLNTILQLNSQLGSDLARFTTAGGWRAHLRLPADALPPAADGQVTLGFSSLIDTLERFDAVTANPGYVQIHSLPSFDAMHSALVEAVTRFSARREQEPAETPAVPPQVRPQNSSPVTPPIPPQDSSSEGPANGPPANREELPTPPPILSAPRNGSANQLTEERSVLSK